MFRLATSRVVRVAPARSFSSTTSQLIKIRPPAPAPPPPSGSSSKTPPAAPSPKQPTSPAERPPRPPPSPASPSPQQPLTEPTIHQQSSRPAQTTAAGSSSTSTSSAPPPSSKPPPTADEPQIPLTPPTPAPTENEPEAAFDRSKLPSLDIDPDAPAAIAEPSEAGGRGGGAGRQRTGAGKKEYVSSIERQRRMLARLGLVGLAVGVVGAGWYMGEGKEGASGSSWEQFKGNMSEVFDYFNKPAFKTLLPDPLPPPHQRPYTLLVDLEGMLVSSSWDRASGWKTAKRPGTDYFLAYLSQFYEIVLFTSQPLYTAAPVAEKLDPYQAYLPYKLFRESTRSVSGKTVKDLTYLNRDLSKVILLDTDPEHTTLQPENAVIMKPWDGRPGDQGLVEMIPFLESIGIYAPADVRPILQRYQGKDIPREYAKKEAEDKERAVADWERTHPSAVHGAGLGALSGLFGSVAHPGQSSRPRQPTTYLEQKRAEAQRHYQEEQKYWKDHADEFSKLIEEDKQRQLAEMKGSLWGYIAGPPPGAGAQPEEKK